MTNNRKLTALLVEDDQFKEASLLQFIDSETEISLTEVRRSLSSAMILIKNQKFDLILLDMSLPTFDISANESGGKPNGFGGWDLMRYLSAKKINSQVIVVTQFETFEFNDQNLTIDTLRLIFNDSFGDIFKGIVKYDSISDLWKVELKRLIENAIK